MLNEKIRELFIKLITFIAAGVLAAGLIIFAAKTLYPEDDTTKEETSSVNMAESEKAPPVEVKGSISDSASKKEAADKSKKKKKRKSTDEENALVTMIPTDSQETAAPENTQEPLENEAVLEPPASNASDSIIDTASSLEGPIQDLISSQYTAGGSVAVSAGRISDGVLSQVNNHSMQAASLIKLFVAGCMYETMGDTSPYESQISSMISVSDNTACNSLVAVLGGGDAQAGMAVINEYCMNHGFYETHMGRLMLQPNDLDDNYTSVQDCGNFLMSIYNGSLAGSSQILQYMKQQERRGKIPAGVPSGVETANKTGELDFVENDAAIIFHPSGAYILCVMSENLSDAYSSRLFINSMSETVYNLMG